MKQSVLVIDSIGKIRLELSGMLRKYNIDVLHAKDGFEAGDKVFELNQSIKLVVWCIHVDNNLEFEQIKKLKHKSRYKNIPLVIISPFTEKQIVFKSIECGASDYILMPYMAGEMLKKISKYLIIGDKELSNYQEGNAIEEKLSMSLKEILSLNFKSAKRGKYPLSVLLLSLSKDDKEYSSDDITGAIVKLLKTKVRETDTIMRYGNTNIVLILPFTDEQGINIVERKIKERVSTSSLLSRKAKGNVILESKFTYPKDGENNQSILSILEKELKVFHIF